MTEILNSKRYDLEDWIPGFGTVAKVQKERFEIATRFFKSLAMT